jgi:hypothetical protein
LQLLLHKSTQEVGPLIDSEYMCLYQDAGTGQRYSFSRRKWTTWSACTTPTMKVAQEPG